MQRTALATRLTMPRNVRRGALPGFPLQGPGSAIPFWMFWEKPAISEQIRQQRLVKDGPELFYIHKAPDITFSNEDWVYSDFVAAVKRQEISAVYIDANTLKAEVIGRDGDHGYIQLPPGDNTLQMLIDNRVEVHYQRVPLGKKENDENSPAELVGFFFKTVAVYMILVLVFFVVQKRMNNGPMKFGTGVGKQFNLETDVVVTFDDVAGAENAKEDLGEIIGFLRNTEQYTYMGARIPKGVLMVGPPGTGKTLMARAIAGEAQVPFFSCSASEFIEMFVGVGASRIRDLFKKAKEQAPCIIFIDEIDAIGKKRSGGVAGSGGNDERDQTINQLLTEMDGFSNNHGVILIAATNRPELLDDALTRPGRFDRQVVLDLPNAAGRRKILELYLQNKPVNPGVNLDRLASMTIGFSGAELENLCNEAAIYSARRGHKEILPDTFEIVYDNITMGAESKTNLITEKKKRVLAYHEAGHALLGVLVGEYDVLRKVSIVSRRDVGGLTFFEPSEERVDMGLYTREYLNNRLIVLMGGRVAEEMVFGPDGITTGAMSDLEVATGIATQMVTAFGFSDHIGPMSLTDNESILASIGSDVAVEIKTLLDAAYTSARNKLVANEMYLDRIADALMERETLTSDDVYDLLWGIDCDLEGLPSRIPEVPTDPYDDD